MKKFTVQNILVPIDFSTISIAAITIAKRLAKRLDASIDVVHVNQFLSPTALVARQSKIVAKKTGLAPWDERPMIGGAAPFHDICRLAKEISTDLILMPTHGYTGLRHVFLGSTAERVVQHSPCPVLVVRRQRRRSKSTPRLAIKKILVPVDFSECSREGLEYAIGFANEFGARIVLLNATSLGYVFFSDGMVYDMPALREAARESAEQQMRELVRTVKFGRVKYETVLTDGSPVLDICSFAKDYDIDLIITATHGLTGWKHALIGSVAERVVRHAPCSVLVVPSHPRARAASVEKAQVSARRRTPWARHEAQQVRTFPPVIKLNSAGRRDGKDRPGRRQTV
jgi:nucleotide-binding universal stress UspA family protein